METEKQKTYSITFSSNTIRYWKNIEDNKIHFKNIEKGFLSFIHEDKLVVLKGDFLIEEE